MIINGINYDSYLAAIEQAQAINTQQNNGQTTKTGSDRDSYISSTAVNDDTAIPSGIYGANGMELETFSSVTAANTDSDTSASQESSSTGGAGGAGGSSDSEEDTETEIVTIDGVTYLQTTTTDENGITTVTKTVISNAAKDDEQSANTGISTSIQ
jgi:hypothetical protein